MFYTHSFRIGLDEVDDDCKLTHKALLRYLENIACFHSDDVGLGVGKLHNLQRAWGLIEWDVRIIERPVYEANIVVKTWSRALARVYAYRDFEVYADDKLVAKASSKWAYIDLEKRRPCRVTSEEYEPYGLEDFSTLGITDIARLNSLDSYDTSFELPIRRSDIDVNGHVHNTNYLDFVVEALEPEELKNINNMRIYYRQEIKYGTTLSIKHSLKDGTHYFSLESPEDIHSLIELS